MEHIIEKLTPEQLPESLRRIESVPQQLYVRASKPGRLTELMARPRVAIVGTRRMTDYGRHMASKLAADLASRGVVIVSGLAFGIDSAAHQAAVKAGGTCLVVLPSPVEQVAPMAHWRLAEKIVETGGVLISEYPKGYPTLKNNFVARNRLVPSLSDILLVVEAADNSGTTHTTGFAGRQNVPIAAVPGHVTSLTSTGPNKLLKAGAIFVTEASDILSHLNLPAHDFSQGIPKRITSNDPIQQKLIDLLETGHNDGEDLFRTSGLSIQEFNHHLTMLEITAKIRSLGPNRWTLA